MKVKNIALLVSAVLPQQWQQMIPNVWKINWRNWRRASKRPKQGRRQKHKFRFLSKQQHPVVAANPVVVESTEPATAQTAPKLTLSGYGDIKFYGDVEFNMDAASKTGSLTSMKTTANKDWAPGNHERWDINGRLLLGFDGYKRMENGNFAGFSVQPLADLTGKMNPMTRSSLARKTTGR